MMANAVKGVSHIQLYNHSSFIVLDAIVYRFLNEDYIVTYLPLGTKPP